MSSSTVLSTYTHQSFSTSPPLAPCRNFVTARIPTDTPGVKSDRISGTPTLVRRPPVIATAMIPMSAGRRGMTTGTPMKGAHRAHRAHLPMIPMILMRGITSHPQAQAQVPMGVVLMGVGTIRHHLAMAMDSRHHTIHHQDIHHQAQAPCCIGQLQLFSKAHHFQSCWPKPVGDPGRGWSKSVLWNWMKLGISKIIPFEMVGTSWKTLPMSGSCAQIEVTHRLLDITGTMDRHHTTDMIPQEDLLEGGGLEPSLQQG